MIEVQCKSPENKVWVRQLSLPNDKFAGNRKELRLPRRSLSHESYAGSDQSPEHGYPRVPRKNVRRVWNRAMQLEHDGSP